MHHKNHSGEEALRMIHLAVMEPRKKCLEVAVVVDLNLKNYMITF